MKILVFMIKKDIKVWVLHRNLYVEDVKFVYEKGQKYGIKR